MTLTNPLPPVAWMPLEGLAQSWAAFASHSTREHAFTSARLAFEALEEETAARRMEGEAQQMTWLETEQAALCFALGYLSHAASSWLSACEQLEEYRRRDLPEEEEQNEQAVLQLLAESYQHLLYVACLSVRLVQELHTVLDMPVRMLVGTMHVPSRKEAL